jgi:hypothetical protein
MFAAVVETVVLVVLTVCGDPPATVFVWSTIAEPEQSLLSYAWKRTLPARFPPCGALTVAESFGMNDCAVDIDDATDVTVTSSAVSLQLVLWSVPFVFGESPLYTATQWYVPIAVGVKLTGP